MVNPGWIAFAKEPVADSFDKNWLEQNELLPDMMSVPNVAEVAWGLMVYSAVRAFHHHIVKHVRTASIGLNGSRIIFENHHISQRLFLQNIFGDEYRVESIGIAACRKF